MSKTASSYGRLLLSKDKGVTKNFDDLRGSMTKFYVFGAGKFV